MSTHSARADLHAVDATVERQGGRRRALPCPPTLRLHVAVDAEVLSVRPCAWHGADAD